MRAAGWGDHPPPPREPHSLVTVLPVLLGELRRRSSAGTGCTPGKFTEEPYEEEEVEEEDEEEEGEPSSWGASVAPP